MYVCVCASLYEWEVSRPVIKSFTKYFAGYFPNDVPLSLLMPTYYPLSLARELVRPPSLPVQRETASSELFHTNPTYERETVRIAGGSRYP